MASLNKQKMIFLPTYFCVTNSALSDGWAAATPLYLLGGQAGRTVGSLVVGAAKGGLTIGGGHLEGMQYILYKQFVNTEAHFFS
jgi:hypothetical protein